MGVDTPRFAIIGRGLIGGSIELALGRLVPAPEVVTLEPGDNLDRAAGADVIFLAAPISENVRILSALPSHVPGGALVTDTGSTKRTTVAAALALPSRLRFIGGHPMAGAASGGFERASKGLFDHRPWILTPSPDTSPTDLGSLRASIESLGAVVHLMDAAEHDRVLAFVSHLPQLAVSALMETVGNTVGADGLAIAGSGLRDSTRLAASPAPMWRDIVESNTDNVGAALDRLIAALQHLRDDRGAALPRIFSEAARWRQVLDQEERR